MDQFAVQILPILLAITLHEYAHGWVARRLGDRTAELAGRLSMNPLTHVDPIGTVLFPLIQWFTMDAVFLGWAKPVPVNPNYFKNPRKDMALVAVGGPAANLLQMFIAVGLFQLFLAIDPSLSSLVTRGGQPAGVQQQVLVPLALMCVYAISINISLIAFNLIPIPPLDGSRVVFAFLPIGAARRYAALEPYGMLIIFGLMALAPGLLQLAMSPVRQFLYFLVSWI